jgi:hypothetical protein
MTNLKPCPFCGNETAIQVLDGNEIYLLTEYCADYNPNAYYTVVCTVNEDMAVPSPNWKKGCGASGGYAKTKEEAIKLWNHRAEDNPEVKGL